MTSHETQRTQHSVWPDLPSPIVTCRRGTNADLFPLALRLYVTVGGRIADVTYGRGVFWRNVPPGLYDVVSSDLQSGVDCRSLPYPDAAFDALVLDPPYMHGGATVKESINACYRNANTSHESVVALYLGGILEARRVLKRQGILVVKCQAEIESAKQRLTHVELLSILPLIGFRIEDEFVLHASALPAMRHAHQYHARKNHSYLLVARLAR